MIRRISLSDNIVLERPCPPGHHTTMPLLSNKKRFFRKSQKHTINTIPTKPPSCNIRANIDKNMFIMLFLCIFFCNLFDPVLSTGANLSMQALHICQNTGTMKSAFISTMLMSASEMTLRVPMTYRLKPADSINEPIRP